MDQLQVGQYYIRLAQHRSPWFALDCCRVDDHKGILWMAFNRMGQGGGLVQGRHIFARCNILVKGKTMIQTRMC